jgi:hypothetical protein
MVSIAGSIKAEPLIALRLGFTSLVFLELIEVSLWHLMVFGRGKAGAEE